MFKHNSKFYALLLILFTSFEFLFGLYIQITEYLIPCPLCILSRYFVLVICIVALFIVLLERPLRLICALMLLSIANILLELFHVYLQISPNISSVCGTYLSGMINKIPLSVWMPVLFAGYGDCEIVQWKIFSYITMPQLALFGSIVIFMLSAKVYKHRPK